MSPVASFFGGLSFLFLLTATILMISSCCSVPTSDDIFFLKTTLSANLAREIVEYLPANILVFDRVEVRMGLLGYCINESCTDYHLGYRIPSFLVGGPLGADLLERSTTRTLVINPLYTAFSSACVVIFLLSIFIKKPVIVFVILLINTILAIICLIIDLNIFVKAFYLVRNSQSGFYGLVSTEYGSALWLMIAAVIMTVLSTLFFACTMHTDDLSESSRGRRQAHHEGP